MKPPNAPYSYLLIYIDIMCSRYWLLLYNHKKCY